MTDPHPDPRSTGDTGAGPSRGRRSCRVKMLAIVGVKVVGVLVVLVLLRELGVQLRIGVGVMVLLHVAVAAALVVADLWRRRAGRGGRGTQHGHRGPHLHGRNNHGDATASGPAVHEGGGHGH